MIHDGFSLYLIMTATVALAYLLADRWRLAQRFGVVMMVILFGMALGNMALVPQEKQFYQAITDHFIPISIALLLFRLDFRELRTLRRNVVGYFALGAMGTVLGTVITYLLFADRIGPDAAKLGGQLAASYIGGGENAVAVAEAVGLRAINFDLFSAAFAADNIVTAIWMMIALSAPFGFSRYFSNEISQEQLEAAKAFAPPFSAAQFLPGAFYSLALAGVVVWLSRLIAAPILAFATAHELQWLAFDTTIVWVTSLALLIAQTPLRKRLSVSYSLGTLLFLYFFFSMGAMSSIAKIAHLGPMVLVFTATIVGIHGIVILAVGKWRKADMATLFIASQCNIGGPATAVALAEANGWHHMIVPSILLGVLGYAIANYIGIALAQVILPML